MAKKQDEDLLAIVNQNIRQLDADLLIAYKGYISHLQDVKEYYVNLKQELTVKNVIKED